MRLIHCTQKLLKEMGNPTLQSIEGMTDTEGLGNWYCNIIRIDRKKCLLFTNAKTLYSFLSPNVMKKNINNIVEVFLTNLSFNLQAEGFGLEVINRIMKEYEEIGFARTASKHVLGAMNQLAFEYEVLIQMKEGLKNIKLLEINRDINRTILKGIQFLHPIDALKSILEHIYQ